MAHGFMTTDNMDFNELLYGVVLPELDVYNVSLEDYRDMLSFNDDETIKKVPIPERVGFHRLAEMEKPQARKPIWGEFQRYAEKWGYNVSFSYDFLLRARRRDIDGNIARAFVKDKELITSMLLKPCFVAPGTNNANWGWWNGEFSAREKITVPPYYATNTFVATHTHYYTSGAATIALADITGGKQTIRHHGNNGPIVGFANSVEIQAIENLAGWAGTLGTALDYRIPNPISDMVAVNGFRGRMIGVDWIETEWCPSGYILLVTTGGGGINRPIAFVELENPVGRGLILFGGPTPQYPIIDSYYLRFFDTAIVGRSAGVAIQITANASYTDPSYYSSESWVTW